MPGFSDTLRGCLEWLAITGMSGGILPPLLHFWQICLCYFSKKFDVHKKKYSTTENEASAIKHFEVYVSGAPLLVYTDQNPLVFINSTRGFNQRIMQWSFFARFPKDLPHAMMEKYPGRRPLQDLSEHFVRLWFVFLELGCWEQPF